MTPGDILITLRTCGDLRRGDVVTVSHTSPSGEYVYLDETDGKIASRADAFMVAVRRPWHAWADPEWTSKARAAAEGFVRGGIVVGESTQAPIAPRPTLEALVDAGPGCLHWVSDEAGPLMPGRMICLDCAEAAFARFASPSPAPVATEAEIRAQAFEYIAQRLEAKARSADLGATFWHGSLHGTSIYNFFTYAADEVRALAEKETSR